MAQYLDSTTLIDSVKRRINIPESQSTFTADDILAFANEELALSIVPAIMSLHEDYLLFNNDVPLQTNKSEYVIPYRAVGNKLYDLQFIDNNHQVFPMARGTAADQPYYEGSGAVGTQYNYYVKNNRVILMPIIDGSTNPTGSLRFLYYIRPNSLVPTNQVGVITSIDTVTGIITVSSVPDAFSTNMLFDFYKAQSPHNILSIDNQLISINGTLKTIQINPDLIPDELTVGDHISLATESCIPNIPSDLHVFLAQKVAERILEAQGDSEGLQNAKAKSAEMEIRAGTIIDNRVEESPFKVINRNGPLRSNLRNKFFNRRG